MTLGKSPYNSYYMTNQEILALLEKALDHLLEVDCPNGYDDRQMGEGVDIIEGLIESIKKDT